jgi:hypothetical protein
MLMKLAATLSFAFIIVSPLSAQQPADWRASVADDNKAATWEGTSAFMA